MRALQDALYSKNIYVDITGNAPLYGVVMTFWKDSTRDALINEMASRLPPTQRTAQRMNLNINNLISSLPPVWKEDTCTLSAMLRDKLSVT